MRRLLILMAILVGCARAPIKNAADAFRPAASSIQFHDDLEFRNLGDALSRVSAQLERNPKKMRFGSREIESSAMVSAYRDLLSRLNLGAAQVQNYIAEKFDLLEVYGSTEWGKVFVTSYYEPVVSGSEKTSEKFSVAVYGTPSDLVDIDISSFQSKAKAYADAKSLSDEAKSPIPMPRGRVVMDSRSGRVKIVPFFDRREIDSGNALSGRKQEIAWLDPIDAFLIHIQGSGTIQFSPEKRIRVGYESQNGFPYVPIGKFLKEKYPNETVDLDFMERYLRSLSKAELMEFLSKNPSYVFFKTLQGRPITSLGTEVTDGRTIATDGTFFPKGALAVLEFQKPMLNVENKIEFVKVNRFVLDQDTGGAIKGPGRVDLFWGSGDEAKKFAGVMRHPGRLWYLIPKSLYSPNSTAKNSP